MNYYFDHKVSNIVLAKFKVNFAINLMHTSVNFWIFHIVYSVSKYFDLSA